MLIMHYARWAWRSVSSRPLLMSLNILGLAVPLTASLFMLNYLHWHWSFDRFHQEHDQIYRVQTDHYDQHGLTTNSALSYTGLPVWAASQFPQIDNFTRLCKWIANDVVLRHNEETYRGEDFYFTDSSFFDVFTYSLLQGNPAKVFTKPNSIVVTEALAHKFFGSENALGKTILFENKIPLIVVGILQNPPANSHLSFDALASLSTLTQMGFDRKSVYGDEQFEDSYSYSYLKLFPSNEADRLATDMSLEFAEFRNTANKRSVFHLQEIGDIHLNSHLAHDIGAINQGKNLWILAAICLLTIFLGCANAINILKRDVLKKQDNLWVRKVVGATRWQIFYQLTWKITILFGLSLAIALVLKEVGNIGLLKYLNIHLPQIYWTEYFSVPSTRYLIIGSVLLPFLTLWVPAWFFAHISHPMIRGSRQYSSNLFQGNVVGLQFFSISLLVCCTVVIQGQVQFMMNKNPGHRTKGMLAVRAPLGTDYDYLKDNFGAFIEQVEGIAAVNGSAISHSVPGDMLELVDEITYRDQAFNYTFYRNYGTQSFFELYDIPMLARMPIAADQTQKRYVIINQLAAELLGFKEPNDALGKQISYWERPREILAVCANHHQRSMQHRQIPIVFDLTSDPITADGYITVAHTLSQNEEVNRQIESLFHKFFPYSIYESVQLEEKKYQAYKAEQTFYRLSLLFCLISALVGCFGLVAMILFELQRRSKELSIRRILGASYVQMLWLLGKKFGKMVSIVVMLVIPLTFYFMQRWLDNFSYQSEIDLVQLLAALMTCCTLVLILVLSYSWMAIRLDPIRHLREE